MNSQNSEEAIVQNLKDAGCDEGTILAFMEDMKKDRLEQGLKRLAAHRRSLLDHLHQEQQQIDRLDYLVFTMRKKANTNSERSNRYAGHYQ